MEWVIIRLVLDDSIRYTPPMDRWLAEITMIDIAVTGMYDGLVIRRARIVELP